MTTAHIVRAHLVLAVGLAVSGCTVGMAARIQPDSHFVYPNSNVTALGPVSSTASGFSFFLPPPIRSPELDRTLYSKALTQQAGADTIIDYVVTSKITTIAILPLYFVSHELKGTAARAEVGRQELR